MRSTFFKTRTFCESWLWRSSSDFWHWRCLLCVKAMGVVCRMDEFPSVTSFIPRDGSKWQCIHDSSKDTTETISLESWYFFLFRSPTGLWVIWEGWEWRGLMERSFRRSLMETKILRYHCYSYIYSFCIDHQTISLISNLARISRALNPLIFILSISVQVVCALGKEGGALAQSLEIKASHFQARTVTKPKISSAWHFYFGFLCIVCVRLAHGSYQNDLKFIDHCGLV